MPVEVALLATSIGFKFAKEGRKQRTRETDNTKEGEELGEVGPTPSSTFEKKAKLNQEKKGKGEADTHKHSIKN